MMPIARTLYVLLAMGLPAAAQAAASATPPAAAPLSTAERANLEAAERADLQDLRAAAFGPAGRLHASERALLREAASRHPELADLRAGEYDLSPREIKIILWCTTAAVVVLALILQDADRRDSAVHPRRLASRLVRMSQIVSASAA